jgi:hypothetical protein
MSVSSAAPLLRVEDSHLGLGCSNTDFPLPPALYHLCSPASTRRPPPAFIPFEHLGLDYL